MRKTVINFQNETGYLSVKKAYELMNHTNIWEPNQDDIHIPSELLCSICSDLLMEAVVVPCCGNSACDECKNFECVNCISVMNLHYFINLYGQCSKAEYFVP